MKSKIAANTNFLNSTTMKTSLQHLLISFIGSLLALACFVGILQLIDNYNDETNASVNQQK